MKTESADVIILGAGPAGLTTAITLARRGFHVAVLDSAAGRPAARNRAHVHNLMLNSYYEIEHAIPEITERLAEKGAVEQDWNADFIRRTPLGVGAPSKSPYVVRVTDKHTWCDTLWELANDEASIRIECGVPVRDCQAYVQRALQPEPQDSPVVIDASGISQIGYRAILTSELETFEREELGGELTYQSLRFAPSQRSERPDALPEYQGRCAVEVERPGEDCRLIGAMTLPCNHDELILSAVSSNASYLGDFSEAPLGWLKDHGFDIVAEQLTGAERLSERSAVFRWNKSYFNRLHKLPASCRLVCIGDALSGTHPVLGLGMSRAIRDGCLVGQTLDRGLDNEWDLRRIRNSLDHAARTDWKVARALAGELDALPPPASWFAAAGRKLRDRFLAAATQSRHMHMRYIERRNGLISTAELIRIDTLLSMISPIKRKELP